MVQEMALDTQSLDSGFQRKVSTACAMEFYLPGSLGGPPEAETPAGPRGVQEEHSIHRQQVVLTFPRSR